MVLNCIFICDRLIWQRQHAMNDLIRLKRVPLCNPFDGAEALWERSRWSNHVTIEFVKWRKDHYLMVKFVVADAVDFSWVALDNFCKIFTCFSLLPKFRCLQQLQTFRCFRLLDSKWWCICRVVSAQFSNPWLPKNCQVALHIKHLSRTFSYALKWSKLHVCYTYICGK